MKIYDELAPWWPLFSQPSDYEEEAAFFSRIFDRTTSPAPRTVLELGSGGGNNASFMKAPRSARGSAPRHTSLGS